MKVQDIAARIHALDITKSFIVQAPAGSGKTTLLVQRYLALLQQAKHPEEIIALTFTRKAAAEMRSRIIKALNGAALPPPSKDLFAYETYQLAKNILLQDAKHSWRLQKNPQRLRIQTLDAFCHRLVRTSPFGAGISPECRILQDQELEKYYSDAAKSILVYFEDPEYAPALQKLFLHLDNDYERLTILLVEMLRRREQWLPYIVPLNANQQARAMLEQTLQNINLENTARCQNFFPKPLLEELWQLVAFATSSPTAANSWRSAASILLTKNFEWRKKITKDQGFPADTKSKTFKDRILALLEHLATNDELRQSLQTLALTPNPQYSEDKWSIVSALLTILPLVVAELKLTFQKHNCADHSEISMAANQILDTGNGPSNLALQLDYQIQHILVDEFQDTSIAQYRLLEKLVAEWLPDDGKTIFAVGDPMQSIYRFREAEVGIFLRTLEKGMANLQLHPLILQTNFRSQQKIIEWINRHFVKIFPAVADFTYGGVPFAPSIADLGPIETDVAVRLFEQADDNAEAEIVTKYIHQLTQEHHDDSIAILARSRSHLRAIVVELSNAHIPFQGVELECLAAHPTILDLTALTRALLHPADRIAWLGILRAPWCGVEMRDLMRIGGNKDAIIWDMLQHPHNLGLSADGQNRIQRILPALTIAMRQRGRSPWRELIEMTWINLNGPALLANPDEADNVNAFFELIDQDIVDGTDLEKKLQNLYAKNTTKAQVQIMTIHKAKGLEFDHVIIPGIHKTTKRDEAKLLMWAEKPRMGGGSDLLIAPIRASDAEQDSISNYLQIVEQKKAFYEAGRLLYVAMTRAKKSLLITGAAKVATNSLLEQMQSCISAACSIDNQTITASESVRTAPKNLLRRIKIQPNFSAYPTAQPAITTSATKPNLIWQNQDRAIIGTVLHQELERVSKDAAGLTEWTSQNMQHLMPYWRKKLLQLGCIKIDAGITILKQALGKIMADPRGRWILDCHPEAASEWAIQNQNTAGEIETLIIDRTFIDATGTRWIIDYKTFKPTTIEEKQQYQDQLIKYCAAIALIDSRPIRSGWYYLLNGEWEEFIPPPRANDKNN